MIIVISSMSKAWHDVWKKSRKFFVAHTFAQISSIEPDVNENVFDDDKAVLSLSR